MKVKYMYYFYILYHTISVSMETWLLAVAVSLYYFVQRVCVNEYDNDSNESAPLWSSLFLEGDSIKNTVILFHNFMSDRKKTTCFPLQITLPLLHN